MKELIYDRIMKQGTIGIPNDLIWYYKSIGMSEEELVTVMLLMAYGQKKGNFYPDLTEMAQMMYVEKAKIQSLIASLMEKECLTIEREFSLEEQVAYPVFSFDPLFKKLGDHLAKIESEARAQHQETMQKNILKKQKTADKPNDIYSIFEEEFGRCLSNMEIAYLTEWLQGDQFSEQLVLEALRSSVSRDKVGFRYIDAILRDWQRKNITTAKLAREEDQKSQRRKRTKRVPKSTVLNQEDTALKYDDLVVNLME